jgi:hypothetical protein
MDGNLSINSGFGRPIARLNKKVISVVSNQDEITSNEIPVVKKIVIPPSDPSKFQIIPDETTERQVLYVAGPSGSGKSTFVVSYLNEYKRRYKKRPVFVLSALQEDETLDKIVGLKRIRLDDQMYLNPLTAEMFEECVVVADDVDCIEDTKIHGAVIKLINSILTVGRHFKTSIIFTNHLATDRGNTRKILNEAHAIVVFPFSGSTHGIKYLLERYCGLEKKAFQEIRKTKSRWACVFKHYPTVIMTEKMLYQPNGDDDDV